MITLSSFCSNFLLRSWIYTAVAEIMSNEEPPAWAIALLDRLSTLEQRVQASPLVNSDPNITLRAPGADFAPRSNVGRIFIY